MHISQQTRWKTNGGNFNMSANVEITFTLPEFCLTKEITYVFAVDKTKNNLAYGAIIGRDLLNLLKMDILWSKGCLV